MRKGASAEISSLKEISMNELEWSWEGEIAKESSKVEQVENIWAEISTLDFRGRRNGRGSIGKY